ncbi:hypothetical protein ACIQH6_13900 [Micromonospora orduensis]|uniref:hypothetical protein n=1 Tax=Micromonospora orduensis TaxID=1420891 RepID=UPI00381A03EB
MPPPDVRRTGRRLRGLLAVALVLLVLAAAYLIVTLRYALATGNSGAYPGAFAESFAGDVREARYLAVPGRTIEYAFSIANRGRLPVRLDKVLAADGVDYTTAQIRMEPDSERGFTTPVAFQPVDLRPDDQVIIWVTLRSPDQAQQRSECGAFWFDTQRVRFTVLGMPREQQVPLGHVIRVTTPDSAGQPCAAYK